MLNRYADRFAIVLKGAEKLRTVIACVIAAICVAAGLTALTSCAPKPSVHAARTIVIAQAGDFFLYAPLYIAVDAHLFEEQGLNVNLISTGGDEKTWAAVLSGAASFGVADPTFVAIAGQRGEPGRVIASIVNGVPFWGITYRSDIPVIKRPDELDGYTVATFSSPSTAYTLQREMYVKGGRQPRIRQAAFGTLEAVLRAHQADIALELEPNVSQAVGTGARVVYSMPDFYGDFAITGLTATPALLEKDPALARAVVCGIELALQFARNRPDESLRILTKRFPEIAPSVAKSAFRRVLSADIIPRSVVVGPAAWKKAVALRVAAGDLKTLQNANSYLDNRYAIRAQQYCRLNAKAGR